MIKPLEKTKKTLKIQGQIPRISKTSPFEVQKESFGRAKRTLLEGKRSPFQTLYIANSVHRMSKMLHETIFGSYERNFNFCQLL